MRKILIVDILMKRGWRAVNRCNPCQDNEESIDYILIHCEKTRVLWSFLFAVSGLSRVFPTSMRNLLFKWKFKGLDKKGSVAWPMAPLCLFWCIWKEHIRRVFNEEEFSLLRSKVEGVLH